MSMLDYIKNLFKREKHALNRKPDSFSKLEQAGEDENGRKYYTYPNLEDLPMIRFIRGECFRLMDDNKLDSMTLAAITDKINELTLKLATEGKKDNKTRYGAQINALTNEMIWRSTFLTPMTILLNIAACLTIREDENPEEWNDSIHQQKIDAFEKMLPQGIDFFFQTNAFKGFKKSLLMSTEDWIKHSRKLKQQEEILSQRLKIILSEKSSKEKFKKNSN